MELMNNKVDGGAGTFGVPTSNHFNQKASEFQEPITSTNMTLSSDQLDQFARAVANYCVVSKSFVDSGSQDSFILSPQSNFLTIPQYLDNMEVYFIASSDSSQSPVVNINFLGDVPIVTQGGVALTNQITAGDLIFLVYNLNSQQFILSQNIGSTI